MVGALSDLNYGSGWLWKQASGCEKIEGLLVNREYRDKVLLFLQAICRAEPWKTQRGG